MKKAIYVGSQRTLILLGLCVILCSAARAQVNFIQITDPHIFDDIDESEGSRLEDRAALASCIEKINQMVLEKRAQVPGERGAGYDFVVVTGDLGIEQLVKGLGDAEKKEKIRAGARELASMIRLSKVPTWLFVPGNNDLLEEKPGSIDNYYDFIAALTEAAGAPEHVAAAENKITIIDLCAKDGNRIPHRLGKYVFIGFNDASFKNTDRNPDGSAKVGGIPALITENAAVQTAAAAEVNRQLKAEADRQPVAEDVTYAYVFYHIPEVDDPYLVTLKEEDEPIKTRAANKILAGNSYVYSAWFVGPGVREEWNKVVGNSNVKGLFAGHFHDAKKEIYHSFKWLRTPEYPTDTLTKLHVCPPLALKKQKGREEQARGFQEVYLDKEGKVSTRIQWLVPGGWSLGGQAATTEDSVVRQFQLGRTYEELERLKEAEAAYAKAADSSWAPTRQNALDALRRVSKKQDSFLSTVNSGWSTSLTAVSTAVSTALITGILTGLLLLALWWFSRLLKSYWKWRGRDKLKIGLIADSPNGAGSRFKQIAVLVYMRLQTHFKPRRPLRGRPKLPLIAKSLSAEVTELLELTPGSSGKYVGWLLKLKAQARYSLEGVIQEDGGGYHLIYISLNDDGKLLKTWHGTTASDGVIREERRLAFAAMKQLVRHRNR